MKRVLSVKQGVKQARQTQLLWFASKFLVLVLSPRSRTVTYGTVDRF